MADNCILDRRLTTPYLRALKQHAGRETFTVILQNPKVPLKTADLFWVPEHDRLKGENVISTLTAPHSFTEQRLRDLAQIRPVFADLPRPWTAIMLGGSNGDYIYFARALLRLKASITARSDAWAAVCSSRPRGGRKPPSSRQRGRPLLLSRMCSGICKAKIPIRASLRMQTCSSLPADSVNMTGGAVCHGKPVYVFYPDGGSAKFSRFHRSLEAHGATRPLPETPDKLETWTYVPLRSAETIAQEIKKRAF